MSRRILTIIACSIVLQAVAAAPAFAWWEWIERLSGAGPFKGVSVDARLLCAIDDDGTTRVSTPSPLGILTTSCELPADNAGRRYQLFAVDLGMRFVWREGDDRFANGERISLTTVEPSISFNLLSPYTRDWDIVDAGVGIGAYWFSSTEFASFHGLFVEPIRFELHTPTNLKDKRWAAAIPRVRLGLLTFPGGFDNADFAAAPTQPPRISRDTVANVGVFFDLMPLLH